MQLSRFYMAWKLVTDGQAACQLLGRYTQSTLAASCVCWIVGLLIVTLWLYQKNLWLFMFEMHLISGITDWWQGCESPPPVKLNIKNGPLPILYIGIYYSFGFSRYFFAFSECFPVYSGFCIAVQYQICYCFSTIFWVIASGLPSAKSPPGSNL